MLFELLCSIVGLVTKPLSLVKERDPVERIRKLVLSHDLATEKELKDIEKEVRKEVDEAIAQAKITQHKWAGPFMQPVDVVGLGLHDDYEEKRRKEEEAEM
ncbi:unnamed protein product [Fraxinus pennsylvanica]|uniref:Dehydrogenase E1 component domain-containing protein n=1 Tax=Fraxinus pennsylvanica TaxID=56036 RepID=A0AAD1ZP67_9LAMI|nr:unnamed protein product [Fraxinus pennsylvanica]